MNKRKKKTTIQTDLPVDSSSGDDRESLIERLLEIKDDLLGRQDPTFELYKLAQELICEVRILQDAVRTLRLLFSGDSPELLRLVTEWGRRCDPPMDPRAIEKTVGNLVAKHYSNNPSKDSETVQADKADATMELCDLVKQNYSEKVLGLHQQFLRMQILSEDLSVSQEIFRTFANQSRQKDFINQLLSLAFDFYKTLLSLLSRVGKAGRTKNDLLDLLNEFESRLTTGEFSSKSLEDLEANLNWEWCSIMDRRDLSSSSEQSKPKKSRNPEAIQKGKDLLYLLDQFEKWKAKRQEETGRERFNPKQWLESRKQWSEKTERLFLEHTDPKLDDEAEVKRLLDNARKHQKRNADRGE